MHIKQLWLRIFITIAVYILCIRAEEVSKYWIKRKCGTEMMNKKTIIISIVIFLAIVAIASVISYKNRPVQKLKRQLSLGDKYLSEMKYEEAILAYEAAIAIEPKSEEAYIGLANAYIRQEDYENALAAVKRGITSVGETEAFTTLKEELEKQLKPKELETKEEPESTDSDVPSHPVDVDWTFDLYDIWRYDLFGKDINKWSVDELGEYLIGNGYLNEEDGGRYYRYHDDDGKTNGAQYTTSVLVYLFTYDNSVRIENDKNNIRWWEVGRSISSPMYRERSYDIDIPDLDEMSKDTFLERLPDGFFKTNGTFTYFNNGYAISSIDTTNLYHCWTGDETSPEIEVIRYEFAIYEDETVTRSYRIEFENDTGQLFRISYHVYDNQ